MSLAHDEQQSLAEIETRLRRSAPRLATRFALFRLRADRGRGPVREFLSPWRYSRPGTAFRFVMLTIMMVLMILIVMLAAHIGEPDRAAAMMPGIGAARYGTRASRRTHPVSRPGDG